MLVQYASTRAYCIMVCGTGNRRMITVLRLFRRAALLAVVVTMLFFDSFAARAIPIYLPQASLIVPVGSGCGLSVPMGAARTWHAIFMICWAACN